MGYKIEFNWVVKLKSEHGLPKKLEKGKIYNFKKPEERIYPLHIPIELKDNSDKILSKIEVMEFKVSKNKNRRKVQNIRNFQLARS